DIDRVHVDMRGKYLHETKKQSGVLHLPDKRKDIGISHHDLGDKLYPDNRVGKTSQREICLVQHGEHLGDGKRSAWPDEVVEDAEITAFPGDRVVVSCIPKGKRK